MTDYDQQLARTHHQVTVQGNNSGNIASGNRDVAQTAATQNQLAATDIAEIMKAVVEAAASLGLTERDRDELVRTAQSAQYELDADDPDPQQVKSLGSKVIRLLGRTTGAVLPVVLTKYLELKLGIEPGA
ncbi:hypothetical protein AB0C12_43160 [Actinoplanes sp. NPDC048967]|uniref:hypothetical protein n=1 Tax=Actinoplanes sp. NPDC048967 TaxID=3155269 RepID=UPI0034027CD7